MTIDLLTDSSWQGEWKWGQVYRSDFSITSLRRVVKDILEQSSTGYLYFYRGVGLPDGIAGIQKYTNTSDRIYTGHSVAFPDLLSYSVPLSFFNFKPFDSTKEHSTWLVSLENCLIDKALLRNQFLDPRFETLAGAGAWWAFQKLYSGAIIRYIPILEGQQKVQSIPTDDQLRIVKYFMGFKWGVWTCIRLMLTGKSLMSMRGIYAMLKLKSQQPIPANSIDYKEWRRVRLPVNPKVSILIPTVNRYPYLFRMLKQLRQQTIAPLEVLVIDQTHSSARLVIDEPGLPLRVFAMSEAGQCRSRNLGLQQVTGEFVLFLDDDDEVYPELVEDHLRNLEYFNADVSCGLCEEPGQVEVPKHFRMIRMADIFSTNNGMVKREVLEQTGHFDMVYDRGQKADGDLGARLYRSGALLVMNPEIKVIHHRAPSGGLRNHNVRKVTYASSRSTVTHFRLPHVTELYFNLKNLDVVQQREYRWHITVGTFIIQGNITKKLAKLVWALVCLPSNLLELRKRSKMSSRIFAARSEVFVRSAF